MPDISIVWDAANSRGDWAFDPFLIAGTQVNVDSQVPFGYGDGVTTQFALAPTVGAIGAVLSAQLYRKDWQGNQRLFSSARTNSYLQSVDLTNAVWSKQRTSLAALTGPDGSSQAATITATGLGGTYEYQSMSVVAGQQYPITIFASAGSIQTVSIHSFTPSGDAAFNLVGAGSVGPVSGVMSNAQIVALGGGWYQCTATLTATATGSINVAPIYFNPNVVGDTASFFGPMFGGSPTSGGAYIPTTTAPATVTDYVLGSAGGVSLTSAPAAGAVLSWSGAYVSNVATGGYIETGNDLQTAVLLSLFTDRVANNDDAIPDGTSDPRGWWGDVGEDAPIGSRLWLLDRSKQTQEVLNNARDYITEALQWLVDDGVVASMDVQTEWTRDTFLGAQITLYQPAGPSVSLQYAWAWQQLS